MRIQSRVASCLLIVLVGLPMAIRAQPHCQTSSTELCLQERFILDVQWFDGLGGEGEALVTLDSEESGVFYFFDEDNLEILAKVVDGCFFNGHYWVFTASTTSLGYTLRASDALFDRDRSYENVLGDPAPAVTDIEAFRCGSDEPNDFSLTADTSVVSPSVETQIELEVAVANVEGVPVWNQPVLFETEVGSLMDGRQGTTGVDGRATKFLRVTPEDLQPTDTIFAVRVTVPGLGFAKTLLFNVLP